MSIDAPLRIAALLEGFPRRWAFAGGWAVDLFLGRETRAHKDVDVAVLRRDQVSIRTYLSERGWTLEKAQAGKLVAWTEGERLEQPIHVVWCRNSAFDPDFLEVLLDDSTETDYVFRRDSSIAVPLDSAFLVAPNGLPILAPEIALLHKAKSCDLAENAADFASGLPSLDPVRRAWLRMAVAKVHPGHPWLDVI